MQENNNSTLIPIFGDIHGNLEGLVNTVKHLQKISKKRFRYVIQLGDFGYFRNSVKEKFRDDLEKGVYQHLNKKNVLNFDFKIIFIRGNHEDNSWLNHESDVHPEGMVTIDNKIYFLPDGRGISMPIYSNQREDIIIAGLGGISPESRPNKYLKDPLIAFTEKSLDKLLDAKGIDVLITHQGTDKVLKGSKTITTLCEILKPKLHLHGHTHTQTYVEIDNVKSYGFAKMPKTKRPFVTRNDFYGVLDLKDLNFN